MKNGTTVLATFASAAGAALAAAAGCAHEASSGAGGTGGVAVSASTQQSAGSTSATGGNGGGGAGGSGGDGAGVRGIARFPATSTSIAVLVDELPPGLTAAQQQFAATHFVGSRKLTLAISRPIRAMNPDFVVLHGHLAMWQSTPGVPFILDGNSWGTDFAKVNGHDSWFWHTADGHRVASLLDGKWLMDVADPGFQGYWIDSLSQQVAAGEYDGVLLDSASPALLATEAQAPPEPRLTGTGARDTLIPELGNRTFIQAWTAWMTTLSAALGSHDIALIPSTGPFITPWDTTPYDLTAGVLAAGYADPAFSEADWTASTNELLSLAAKDKIVILQNHLTSPADVDRRLYYLANYLLVRAKHTYLDYFADGAMEWYPEWGIALGSALGTASSVADLLKDGVYRRDFEKGIVLVNPTSMSVKVTLAAPMHHVVPMGGGAIDANGAAPGTLDTIPVTSIDVAAKAAAILIQ